MDQIPDNPHGQMAWIAHPEDISSLPQRHLYIRRNSSEKWKYYKRSPYGIKDSEHLTEGMATLSILLSKKWKVIPPQQVIFHQIAKPKDYEQDEEG